MKFDYQVLVLSPEGQREILTITAETPEAAREFVAQSALVLAIDGGIPTYPPAHQTWMNVRESACYLRCHPSTIRRAVDDGELPAGRYAGLFSRSDLDRLAEGQKQKERAA